MAKDSELNKGDKVAWQTHGTTTHGTVERKITSDTKAAGRQVRADEDDPQYLVKSDKSGREAVHKPEALRQAGQAARAGRQVSPAGSSSQGSRNAGTKAADSAEDAGQQAMASKPFRILLTVGLIAYGVVHILIGWIALQIAWCGSGEGEEASQKGALAQLAGPTVRCRRCSGSWWSDCSR